MTTEPSRTAQVIGIAHRLTSLRDHVGRSACTCLSCLAQRPAPTRYLLSAERLSCIAPDC